MIWTETPAISYCYHKVQRREGPAPCGAGEEDGAVLVAESGSTPSFLFCFVLLFGRVLWHVGP